MTAGPGSRELPPAVADEFQTALGLDDPPGTLDEWLTATTRRLEAADVSLGVEDLCLASSSRHRAHAGDEVYHFRCVLDTLLVPFVLEDPGEVTVRTRSPAAGTELRLAVTRDGVAADPAGAVLSLGVETDVDPPEGEDVLAYGYERFCPYVNAFPDRSAYEAWAADTPEAATMALSVDEGFELARTLGRRLAE